MLFLRQPFVRVLLAAVLLHIPSAARAQAPEAMYRDALAALQKGDREVALQLLERLGRTSHAIFARNNLDYLLARLQQQSGNLTVAASLYQEAAERRSILAEYCFWHLAEIARTQRNQKGERDSLVRLLAINSRSTLASAAHRALADSYLADGDYPFAIAVLQSLAETRTDQGRESMARLGEAYAQAADLLHAREVFSKLLGRMSDEAALEAARGLDELDRQESHEPSASEHLQRGRIYLANREFTEARSHFEKLLAQPADDASRAEAMFSIGRSYYLEEDNAKAVEWYERVHELFPNLDEGETAYYHVGHVRQKAGLFRDAVRRYDEFLAAYPKSQWVGGACLNAIDSLRAAGLTTEALVWCERARANPSLERETASATVTFEEAKVYFDQKKYDQALGTLDRLLRRNLSRSGPGSASRQEVRLLRAYCYEQMGRISPAVRIYLSIPDGPEAYWGNRANLRLHALAKTQAGAALAQRLARELRVARSADRAGAWLAAKQSATLALRLSDDSNVRDEMFRILFRAYSYLPKYRQAFLVVVANPGRSFLTENASGPSGASHLLLGRELAFLGLYDEALPELTAAEAKNAGGLALASFEGRVAVKSGRSRSHSPDFSIALLAATNNRADLALKYGEPALRSLPRDTVVAALSRDFARVAYPLASRDRILAESQRFHFDPRLMLAIAMHESRFDPNAKSVAAARGLLQFTPATAREVSALTDLKRVDTNDLYRSEVSITLGAALLDKLGKQFHDNPYAISAAYNAGPNVVARWLARAKENDPDRFVVEIGYRETKEYVQRVMASYWVYVSLFDEHLNPRR